MGTDIRTGVAFTTTGFAGNKTTADQHTLFTQSTAETSRLAHIQKVKTQSLYTNSSDQTHRCFLDRSIRYYVSSYLQKCTCMFHSNGLKTNLDAEILWTLFPSAKRKLQNHSLFLHLHSIAASESMDRNQQRNLALPTHFILKDFNTAAFCQDTRGLSWLPVFNMKM